MLPSGSYVALVTPMDKDGCIDWQTLHHLVEWHIECKTHGLVVLGTTGEAPTITPRERVKIIEQTVEQANGRIPIIVGAGTNSTQLTIERIQEASLMGADACMLVTPYYNKPTQEGLFQHFKSASEASNTPILIYNVPSRTGVDLQPETVLRLSEIQNIIGLKDATGNMARFKETFKLLPSNFMQFSGDDATACQFMQAGGHGVISVIANVLPKHMGHLCQAALLNDHRSASKILEEISPLIKLCSLTTNPIPVKFMLNYIGKIGPGIRLPLVPLSSEKMDVIKDAIGRMGLISTAQSLQA